MPHQTTGLVSTLQALPVSLTMNSVNAQLRKLAQTEAGWETARRFADRAVALLMAEPTKRVCLGDPVAPQTRAQEAQGWQASFRDEALVVRLCTALSGLLETVDLAQTFVALLRARTADGLSAWLDRAIHGAVPILARFARGLRAEGAALVAAFTSPWSNGQVEGQVVMLQGMILLANSHGLPETSELRCPRRLGSFPIQPGHDAHHVHAGSDRPFLYRGLGQAPVP